MENNLPKFHSFPLTYENASRRYVHVLMFYEPLHNTPNKEAISSKLYKFIYSNKYAVLVGIYICQEYVHCIRTDSATSL